MKTKLVALCVFCGGIGFTQTQGEIHYTTKINMHAELPDDENGRMIKQMIPEFQEMKSILLFTPTESIYAGKPGKEADETIEEEDGNVQIKLEMSAPDEKIYTDIQNGIVVEQRDLMGKIFLVKDTLKKSDWRVKDEQKMVSGILCQKAELIHEEDTVVAWFTSQIPVSTGPSGFGGLPGLIVHVSMNGGNFQITATNIINRVIGPKEIKPPTKGKSITDKAFQELEQEKMKEMQEQYGGEGGGNFIMITN